MKGLILSGGHGTRLRPLTYTRAKQLIPLANKPVLFYAIEALQNAGIHDIGIIVGDTHAEIEMAVKMRRWEQETTITFIQQDAPLGLAHAVKIAQPFIGAEKFVMFLGDNLIGESLLPMAQDFARDTCPANCRILLKDVPNPSQFGVAVIDPATKDSSPRVIQLIEKPKVPPSNLALVGIYFFSSAIFTAVNAIQPSARGELEITDAIQWLLTNGQTIEAHQLKGYWIDTGKMEDILDANRQVLKDLSPVISSDIFIDNDSVIIGDVSIQSGAHIERSVIRGPAIIGEHTTISNAYIGPYTSIYHHARFESCEIEYSIALEYSSVSSIPYRIEESLIGRYAEIYPASGKPHGLKLMLGDHSRTGIPDFLKL